MKAQLILIINTVLTNNDLKNLEELDSNLDLQNDLNMDSIVLAELTVRIEDQFDVDVFEDGMIHTIGDLLEKIEKNNN
jgi:acyl carrier protein